MAEDVSFMRWLAGASIDLGRRLEGSGGALQPGSSVLRDCHQRWCGGAGGEQDLRIGEANPCPTFGLGLHRHIAREEWVTRTKDAKLPEVLAELLPKGGLKVDLSQDAKAFGQKGLPNGAQRN